MKIKRKQFTRLKEIAESVNQVLPGTGIKLDRLIADIESVQKVKAIIEEPLSLSELAIKKACDKHRKDVEDNIANEYGWDKNPLGVDAKRVKVVDLDEPISTAGFVGNIEFTGNIFNDSVRHEFAKNYIRQGESMVAASSDKSTGFKGGLREAVKALAEPKVGDVGYFWTTGNDIRYGIIKEISSSEFKGESYIVYRISDSDGCEFYTNFSKTPPELK